jgi:hypothetical protein
MDTAGATRLRDGRAVEPAVLENVDHRVIPPIGEVDAEINA